MSGTAPKRDPSKRRGKDIMPRNCAFYDTDDRVCIPGPLRRIDETPHSVCEYHWMLIQAIVRDADEAHDRLRLRIDRQSAPDASEPQQAAA